MFFYAMSAQVFSKILGGQASYIFQDTGWVTIRQIVTNKNNCKDTIDLRVDVVPINTIFMPNAFLPASTGENEEFKPIGNGFGIKEYKMSIYDRYGNEVFNTDDFNQGWSGKTKKGECGDQCAV